MRNHVAILLLFLSFFSFDCDLGYASEKQKMSAREVDCTIVSVVRMADGIGKQAVELIEALQDDICFSFVPVKKVSKEEMDMLSEPIRNVISKQNNSNGKVLIYEDLLTRPPRDKISKKNFWKKRGISSKNKDQLRFAYSMFESSRIPKAWVDILNHYFDGILVPDEFLVKVYQDSGVKIPIFVLPLGVQLKPFLERSRVKRPQKPRVFANFSALYERKNIVTLVKAFAKAFGNRPDVQLRLNCRRYSLESYQEICSEIASRGLKNIFLETGVLTQKEYISRFLEVDCYINVAYGEGFSIQPREAMILGIPVVLTNNSAQTTICKSGLVRSIAANIELSAEYKGQFAGIYGVWYGCSVDDVAEALLDMHYNYDQYLQKTEQARTWAAQYDYSSLRPLYLSVIKPKKVILGNENKIHEEHVTTTSRKLLKKYQKIFPTLI